MITKYELLLYLLPCVIQIFLVYIDFRYTKLMSNLISGVIALLLLSTGMIMMIGVVDDSPSIHGNTLLWYSRILLFAGCIIWVSHQVFWMTSRVKIVK